MCLNSIYTVYHAYGSLYNIPHGQTPCNSTTNAQIHVPKQLVGLQLLVQIALYNIDSNMIRRRWRRGMHRSVWFIARPLHIVRPIAINTIPELVILWDRGIISICPRNDIPIPPSPTSTDGENYTKDDKESEDTNPGADLGRQRPFVDVRCDGCRASDRRN